MKVLFTSYCEQHCAGLARVKLLPTDQSSPRIVLLYLEDFSDLRVEIAKFILCFLSLVQSVRNIDFWIQMLWFIIIFYVFDWSDVVNSIASCNYR